jgi:hypothetical protein
MGSSEAVGLGWHADEALWVIAMEAHRAPSSLR